MGDTRTPIDPQGRHGLEHLLGINGIKNNPDRVNLDTINPVVDMSMTGHSRIHDPDNMLFKHQQITLGAGASSSIEEWIVSHGNSQSLIPGNDLVYRIGYMCRIIAIFYRVHIEDPLAALANRSYRIYLTLGGDPNSIPFWSATHGIAGNPADGVNLPQGQYYQYPGDWFSERGTIDVNGDIVYAHRWGSANQIRCPIIPSTWGVKIHAYTNCQPFPAANYFAFPILSFMDVDVLCQQVPIGAPVPTYW